MKWSYKTVHFELKKEGLLGGAFLDEAEIEEQLNQYGQSGWELISVIEVQNGIICFFRQPLTTSPLVYEDRFDESGEGVDWYEEDAYGEDRFEPHRRGGLGDPDAFDEADTIEQIGDPETPVIDEYEIYEDADLEDAAEPEPHDDEIDTIEDIPEETEDTDDDPDANSVGAIRIE